MKHNYLCFGFFSDSTNPSYLKEAAEAGQLEFSYFFFDGDANDPDVQAVIKTNYVSFMKSPMVPPFFCVFTGECEEDYIEVYAGSSGITKYKKLRKCQKQIKIQKH